MIAKRRATKLIVDRQILNYNLEVIQSHIGDKHLFPVLKANAYGHDIFQMASFLSEKNITAICVAMIDEALEVRRAGFNKTLLVMGPMSQEDIIDALEYNISCTCSSIDWLENILLYLEDINVTKKLNIHLKIDSGMGRYGFTDIREVEKAIQLINSSDLFYFEGIYTHYANAEELEDDYYFEQMTRFKTCIETLNLSCDYIHSQNTAGVSYREDSFSNAVRIGMGLYHSLPAPSNQSYPLDIQPASTLITEIDFVKFLEKGAYIGYVKTYKLAQDSWIATIPIGYGDGFNRSFQNFEVIIDNKKVPIIGKISMDSCILLLPKRYDIGTKVTIFGGNQWINTSYEAGAQYVGTIVAELFVGLNERIERVFIN